MPFIPFPEYRGDVNDFRGQHTQVLSGVLPRGDGWGPMPDLQAYTAALPSACRGMFYARKADGSIVVFAGTIDRLFRLDNSTLAWTDVSKGGSAYSDLPSTDQWQFTQFGDNVVALQANSAPQVYNVSSSSAFADLSGSPPTARYGAVVNRHLVLCGLTGNPNRVHWSDRDSITNWSSGLSSSVDLPDGGVVRGVAGGEFGIIGQESQIRRMVYVPNATTGGQAFQIERISEEKGLLGPYSLVRAGERVLFVSQQGFQEYAGGVLTPIGKERVDRTFLADLDASNLQLLIGASDPAGTRAFWAYKSIGSSNDAAFDKIICYDIPLQRFSPPISISGEYIAPLVKPGVTLDALDDISASIDALPFTLDSVQVALASRLAGATTSHEVGFFDGNNVEAVLEIPEQSLEGRRMLVRGFEVRTDATTVYGSVRHRANAQSNLSQTAETLINAQGRCMARIDTKLARARVRIPAGELWTYAMGIEPDFQPTGTR